MAESFNSVSGALRFLNRDKGEDAMCYEPVQRKMFGRKFDENILFRSNQRCSVSAQNKRNKVKYYFPEKVS